MMALPATPEQLLDEVINPAAELLPAGWNTPEAQVMQIAIALQESGLATRRQYGDGPARSLWQFERGTQASRGGVWGIYLHPASRTHLQGLCEARGVPFDPASIWSRIEVDDLLAACCARLLLRTDPYPLPAVNDFVDPVHHIDPKDPKASASWKLYYARTWRPGRPHPEKWPANHSAAVRAVTAL